MAVVDTRVSWLSHTSANTNFFPKPQTTFLTCFSRGERQKYAGKKFRLNRILNSKPLGHESDILTTEPPGQFAYLKADFIRIAIFYLSRNTSSKDKSRNFLAM